MAVVAVETVNGSGGGGNGGKMLHLTNMRRRTKASTIQKIKWLLMSR